MTFREQQVPVSGVIDREKLVAASALAREARMGVGSPGPGAKLGREDPGSSGRGAMGSSCSPG